MDKFDSNAADTLVSRILEELSANPEAKWKLFNALLSDEMKQLPSRVSKLQDDVDELKEDVGELKEDVDELKDDVQELKTDMAEVKTDLAEVKTDLAEVKTDMVEVKADMAEAKRDIRELKNSNAEMKGQNLEFKLGVRAKAYVCQWLSLRNPVVLSSYVDHLEQELDAAVEKAKQEGRISGRQETRIIETDVILRAKLRSDGSPVCVAVEASYTIDANDINRVKESADALHIVTGLAAIPVAAGYIVSDQTERYAEELGVEIRLVSS